MTSPFPVPARITTALDLRGLYGPEVDEACGVAEPAVDQWEAGEIEPTPEQVARLAELTGFPVAFFYEPVTPGEYGPAWICDRAKRKNACTYYEPPQPVRAPLGAS